MASVARVGRLKMLAAASIAALLAACATAPLSPEQLEMQAWASAASADTPAAYEAYLRTYADWPNAADAPTGRVRAPAVVRGGRDDPGHAACRRRKIGREVSRRHDWMVCECLTQAPSVGRRGPLSICRASGAFHCPMMGRGLACSPPQPGFGSCRRTTGPPNPAPNVRPLRRPSRCPSVCSDSPPA